MFKPEQILRVLVAEGPNGNMTSLMDFFRFRGFQSVAVSNDGEVLEELETAAHHVSVLDCAHLGDVGQTIQQIRRRHGYHTGVVVLCREGEQAKRIHALNSGADACLARPVNLEELEAVVWQIYQRLRLNNPAPEDSAFWAYYPQNGVLASASGRRINLTGSESRVLTELAANCGNVVERQKLIDIMAPGGAPGDTRRLDVLISRLKAKVKSQTGDELSIRTFRNMGYALSEINVIA